MWESRRWIFVRDFNTSKAHFKKDFELILFRGLYTINGYMLDQGGQKLMDKLVKMEDKEPYYLKELNFI